jgi:hypothetical protein
MGRGSPQPQGKVVYKGDDMALDYRHWQAQRNRSLNHFEVLGVITNPEARIADGAYVVTTGTSLEKLDHQPCLPSILLLQLYVSLERQFPYTPPTPTPSYYARYYREPLGADEDACAKVRIMYNGTMLGEIDVQDN